VSAVADPAEIERFRAARQRVIEAIGLSCARAGRAPEEVELVAVSKTVPVERVRAAIAAGHRVFGENRVQEGSAKADALRTERCTWRLIGPLQANKARPAVQAFDSIDAVGSLGLARRVDRVAAELRPGRPLAVLLQVNVDADPAKHGWQPDVLETDLEEILALDHLRIDGLMTIGRAVAAAEDARPAFAALRTLSERLRARDRRLGGVLSMGMTDDFPVAVEEGATHVRVGRALFGDRPVR
jgi:PLP dependent protein